MWLNGNGTVGVVAPRHSRPGGSKLPCQNTLWLISRKVGMIKFDEWAKTAYHNKHLLIFLPTFRHWLVHCIAYCFQGSPPKKWGVLFTVSAPRVLRTLAAALNQYWDSQPVYGWYLGHPLSHGIPVWVGIMSIGKCHSKSSEITLFNRSYITSYQ